jgi:hypothetical protein
VGAAKVVGVVGATGAMVVVTDRLVVVTVPPGGTVEGGVVGCDVNGAFE